MNNKNVTDGRFPHNQHGYHTLEIVCLPNGDYSPVLIWNEKR